MRLLLCQVAAPEFADIREPIQIIPWGTIALFAAAAILLALAGFLLWKKRKEKIDTAEQIRHQVSPIDKARIAFQRLREEQIDLADKAYTSAVSGVIRDYLEDAYRLPAPERTTEEFFALLRVHKTFDPDMQDRLMGFLQQSDLIKFARQELSASQREPLLTGAEDFVESAERKRLETPEAVTTTAEEKAG